MRIFVNFEEEIVATCLNIDEKIREMSNFWFSIENEWSDTIAIQDYQEENPDIDINEINSFEELPDDIQSSVYNELLEAFIEENFTCFEYYPEVDEIEEIFF